MGRHGQPPLRCQTVFLPPPLPRRTPIAKKRKLFVLQLMAFPWNPQADSGSPIMRWRSVEEVVRERGSEGPRIMLRGRPCPGALPSNKCCRDRGAHECMSSLPRWRLPVASCRDVVRSNWCR